MIKRVIYLVESTFNLRDYKRFGIKTLEKNSFDVEVWDLTQILQPAKYRSYVPPDQFDYDGLINFTNKEDLLKSLASLGKNDFVITLLGYYFKAAFVYKALSKLISGYALVVANVVPDVEELRSFSKIERLKNIFPLTPVRVKSAISARLAFSKFPFRWFGIKPARLMLAGGACSGNYPYPVSGATEVIWIHSLDYDRYLEEMGSRQGSFPPKVVFLDEYAPFHPDWKHFGFGWPVSADKYYRLLNNFFQIAEDALGMDVVIAAHPRSCYGKAKAYFGDRKVIIGQTCRLVRESSLVLCHASTSLSFANLFGKPALFMTFAELDNHWEGRLARTMAKRFGKEVIFIDRETRIDWDKEMTIDRTSYERYKQAFIKKDGTQDLPFWEIAVEVIRKL